MKKELIKLIPVFVTWMIAIPVSLFVQELILHAGMARWIGPVLAMSIGTVTYFIVERLMRR